MPGGAGYLTQGQYGPPQGYAQQLPGNPEPARAPNPFPQGLGYDPAKPPVVESKKFNTRVELPAEAYMDGPRPAGFLPLRKTYNTTGKDIIIRLNQFKVEQWPQRDVYQFDINFGNGAEKPGKVMAAWKSVRVQNHLKKVNPNAPTLWDGNKIMWAPQYFSEQRICVDFDEVHNRHRRTDRATGREILDNMMVIIRPTKTIRMAALQGYLTGKVPWDNTVMEAITFLDHLFRQTPSESYTMIKRSFFSRGGAAVSLDNIIFAMKGVYSSIRLCNPNQAHGTPSTGLAINVDVANGTFWSSQEVHQVARNLIFGKAVNKKYIDLRNVLKPIMQRSKDNKQTWLTMPPMFKELRRLHKLKFTVKHRGKGDDNKVYTIHQFSHPLKDANPSEEGSHAKNTKFNWFNRTTGQTQEITVYEYFKAHYNMDLEFWYLPLVQTEKKGMFPMEVCVLMANQRYSMKLNPEQTASMIKFAVTRPKQRLEAIYHGLQMLKWHDDRYLKFYQTIVDPRMTETKAKLIQNPEIQFTGSKINPGTSGKWDLRGKKFLVPGEPLTSWGIIAINKCVDIATMKNFANVFIQTYAGHGGVIKERQPMLLEGPPDLDLAQVIDGGRNQIGNKFNALPQIIFFVLPGRDSWMYERLKKNMECRFAMVSQCLNMSHVMKANAQYCSNVAMKVNAKLGGTTCKVVCPPTKPFFKGLTMVIGADVSHAAPQSPQGSMAALTVSLDKDLCRYAASVETNGSRVEMITKDNLRKMLTPHFKSWVLNPNLGGGKKCPDQIYYFRDGVSEGQYSHVLDQEVAHMQQILKETPMANQIDAIKWVVVICTKRHHVRFFPKDGDSSAGDRNGNAYPGTLVERDVTHPFQNDFYLCSHSAIQGTARPVHYHIIKDDIGVNADDFQRMIYHHSYQYMRSTTPISLYPAVYYAHLASNRARSHENAKASEGPRGGEKFDEIVIAYHLNPNTSTKSGEPKEILPLVPMGGIQLKDPSQTDKIRASMWYI